MSEECRINSCCCFDNTRSGSIACGIYSGITAVLIVLENAVFLSSLKESSYDKGEYVSVETNVTWNKKDKVSYTIIEPSKVPRGGKTYIWISLLVNISVIFVSLLLIHAVVRDHRRYMLPWMLLMGLRIFTHGFFMVALLLFALIIPVLFVIFVPVALFIAFEMYCFICVYSQYKLLGENLPEYVEWSKATSETPNL